MEITDLPDYAESCTEINHKIDAIQGEINRMMADSSKVRESVRADLNAVNDQLRFVQGILAKEAVKEQTMKRVEELKADARNAA